MKSELKVSIIIPTYNSKKEEIILQIKKLAEQNEKFELILSDAEYNKLNPILPDILNNINNKLIQVKLIQNPDKHTALSRAKSMNTGAENANGDILLFLHIDNYLPKNAIKDIKKAMTNENIVAGAFLKKYHQSFMFSFTQKLLNIRTKYGKKIVGTNALFVRKSIFLESKFPEQFMEDVAYSDYLITQYTKNKVCIINNYIQVSARKYIKQGPSKQIIVNAFIMFLYRIAKVPAVELEELYKSGKGKSLITLIILGFRKIKIRQGIANH